MSEPWTIFAAVAAAHALGVSSPGPDFAVVLRHTLRHGRRAGVMTALGIGSGILVHVAWGLFGLGWAVDRVPALMSGLRVAGGLFLVWMGLGALRAAPLEASDADIQGGWQDLRDARAFAIGLATNLLNAKAFLFFVALSSSVIAAGASTELRLGLGLWMVLATAAFFSFIAWTAGLPGVRASLRARAHQIDRIMGAVLVALGLAVLVGF